MTNEFAQGCAYVGEDYVPLSQAALPITDWGFLRGDCVYDAIPFSEGRLFRLRDHIDRFWESMEKWRLECPLDKSAVHAVCHGCVSRSQLRSGLLLIITTRGLPPSSSTPIARCPSWSRSWSARVACSPPMNRRPFE